ncbi:2'-5' RNA ligase family protein [Kribbella sp. NPDC058245]|uniref:2'-5' RNA ligase family protein n=1 Tax=Kribbella sp. NPDC058245 TaxID=3346399 RepID=UPI0036EF6679
MNDAWATRRGLTAILITVPELAAYTDRWRSVSRTSMRPDVPLNELIPPHVTVLVPWLPEPTEADIERLRVAVDKVPAFDLSFLEAGQFPNGTAWLRPEPFDEIRGVIQTVAAAFPECPPYNGEFPDPHPHLTISSSAQGGPAVVADAQATLALEPAPVAKLTELGLWRDDEHGVWSQFGSVVLGG